MSKFFKIGGRYGMRSGSSKWKNLEIVDDYKGRTFITMGCGPVMAVSSFPFDTTSNAEQVAALCKVYDASATTQYYNFAVSGTAAGYTSNYQFFPDTEAIGDAVYFGYASKFACMYIDMSGTVGVYNDDACVWEYWNGGAWASFTPYDETDTTAQDGQRPFQGDGYVLMKAGADWGTCDVDSQNAYWIRCRVSAAEITTIGITDSKEHEVTTLTNGGTVVNSYGNISRGLFRFETASASNNDTKVVLVNITSGNSSSVKTITKAIKDADVADFDLNISRGDSIAFFCTQIDGSTEFAGGTCELAIDHS